MWFNSATLMNSVKQSCFNSLQAGRGVQSIQLQGDIEMTIEFQFPSSGKGCSKLEAPLGREVTKVVLVSIPFKREGVFKAKDKVNQYRADAKSFNSLQAGRGVQRMMLLIRCKRLTLVSIPFKREGVFKGVETEKRPPAVCKFQFPSSGKGCSKRRTKPQALLRWTDRFNSLQAGRGVQRLRTIW